MKKFFRLKDNYGPIIQIALITLATYFVLFGMVSAGIAPERYDIQIGLPSSVTILASKDVDDTVTTEAMREAAAAAVEPSYKSVDTAVMPQVLSDLDARFTGLLQLRELIPSADDISAEVLETANNNLSLNMDAAQLSKLLSYSDASLRTLFSRTSTLVREALNSTVPEGQESTAVTRIGRDLIAEGNDSQLVATVIEITRSCMKPNMLIDEDITEANRQKAREMVETETRVRGEVIVREGEIVTEAQYSMLSSLGVIKNEGNDLPLLLGVALIVLILVISTGLFMYLYARDVASNPKMILLLSLIFVIVIGLSLGLRAINPYLMPVSLCVLLIAILIKQRVALFANFVLAVLVSLLTSFSNGVFSMAMLSILIMSIFSGPTAAIILSRYQQRVGALFAGLAMAVTNFLTTLAVGLISSANTSMVVSSAIYAAAGALIGAVLCIGIQPVLEMLFNLVTSAKLLELSNPNQPLLRRMLLEAPGTYHHSIIVANLAEAGANAVGGNGLLARVGAYYHDVGKLKRPLYFKENQMGDNPHDRTDPRVSTAILTAHTRDGAQMAQKMHLPEAVLDIIRQHHGDTPVIFFYDKAVKLYGEENTDIANFRYEGPRPRSKESAVVMLADSIEAAARALPNPDPERLDSLIRKIVKGKLNDGQLDGTNLTFSDLDRICSAFAMVLSGAFHERIEYPEVHLPPRDKVASAQEDKAEAAPAEAPASASPAAEPTIPGKANQPEEGNN